MASGGEGKAFFAEYASQGRAKCKNCKEQIAKTSPRIGKVVNNPFSDDGGTMKQWYHVTCIFDSLTRARATTKKIESTDDLEGFDSLKEEEKSKIRGLIKDFASKSSSPSKKVKKPVQIKLPFGNIKASSTASTSTAATKGAISATAPPSASKSGNGKDNRDNSFREFRRLCIQLSEEPGYNAKTKIIANFFKKGSSGEGFTGDLFLWVKMLLPGVNKRVYNLQSKQLIKLFSQIFSCSQEAMLTDLEQGDVSDTISKFFQENKVCKPLKKSTLTLPEVDALLEKMSKVTRDDDQQRQLANAAKRCTTNDLRFLVRLIKHDLRMNTGAKHVLEALDPDAYQAFQASNNLRDVVERCAKTKSASVPGMSKKLSIRASVMTPVKPMLAEACKSFSHAIKKCPKGMYAEIKYDGERVQLHKSGNQFEFYSRSLKPVLPHKVAAIKEYLSKACPHANDLILDSEVLLVDKTTGNPLPFGTLGIHKKSAFKDASVCLFVFDCLQFNDENLMKKCMKERREILEKNVTVIPNRIMLSEMNFVTTEKELSVLMARAIKEGLEGLVLKDVNGIYEPGKRHWLKMKKDYLAEGAMADTADLVALGAYYGTGNKGGLMSIFLMGVYDTDSSKWRTVAKCGNGHDDKTIERLSKELPMKKIGKDPAKVPSWLDVHRSLVPDFVIKDPKKAPVWEITGAEFSKSSTHTADGISIRFPRVTRIRDDKNWETATDLAHLKTLFKNSRASTDVSELLKPAGGDDNDENEEETEVMETEKDDHKDDEKKNTAGNTQAGKKRKMEKPVDIGGTPKKKAKPSCKYGSKCYQKNPEHFRTYSHPEEDTGDEKSKRKSKDLPNIFTGLKIFLHDSVKDLKKLKRYVIAYDGDIVADYEMSSATHVISDSKISGDGAAKVVKSDWLRQCVKKQQLLAEEKFKFP